jgi:hypothetical protein
MQMCSVKVNGMSNVECKFKTPLSENHQVKYPATFHGSTWWGVEL